MPNYNYVINSSYKPYSLQEMLVPLEAYKEAYNEAEEKYLALSKGANEFEYLANTLPDGSKAKEIYNNYANDLKEQAKDFEANGLNISNRGALTTLRRRYTGEIGRLEKANEVLQEELKRRRESKDTSMLYGNNNLTIDDFLDNNTPNLYKVSGNDLMSLGQEMGKAISQRRYRAGEAGSIMGNQYNIFKETQGISPEELSSFMQTEGARIADSILAERGVTGNLSGADYDRARMSVLNGIYSGIVYNESNKPVSNGEYMSAAQRDTSARAWRNQKVNEAENGITWVNGEPQFNPEKSLAVQKAAAVAAAKGAGNKNGGAAYDVRNKAMTMVGAKTGNIYKEDGTSGKGTPLDNLPMQALSEQEYAQLIDAYGNIVNPYLRSAIGNGQLSDYEIYVIHPDGDNINLTGTHGLWPWNWGNKDLDEDVYVAIPRESKRAASEFTGNVASSGYGGSGDNDIPE